MLAGDPPRDRRGLRRPPLPSAAGALGLGASRRPLAAASPSAPPSPWPSLGLLRLVLLGRGLLVRLLGVAPRRRPRPTALAVIGRRPPRPPTPRPRPPRSSSRSRRRHRRVARVAPADASWPRTPPRRRRPTTRRALADPRDDLADRERRALLGDDLERAVRVGLVRHRGLVGLDLDELLALGDLVPRGLEPLEDRALLHGVGQPRHGHVGHARQSTKRRTATAPRERGPPPSLQTCAAPGRTRRPEAQAAATSSRSARSQFSIGSAPAPSRCSS